MFYKNQIILFTLLLLMAMANTSLFSQKNTIADYIPYEERNLKTHPIITLKTTPHLVYKSESDPQNIT